MTKTKKAKIAPPEIVVFRKVAAFFENDKLIEKVDFNRNKFQIKLYAKTEDKAIALEQILKNKLSFGGYDIAIDIYLPNGKKYAVDRNGNHGEAFAFCDQFEVAFKGNPFVKKVMTGEDAAGNIIYYVLTKNVGVQYASEDTYNPWGMSSVLAQDLLKELICYSEENYVFVTTFFKT